MSLPGQIQDTPRLPWPIAAAGLTGLLILLVTAGPLPLIFVFAVLILASYVVPFRLEGATFNRWWVRIALITIVILLNQEDPRTTDFAIGAVRVRNILAQLYAAEFVVQCYRRSDNPVFRRMFALAMSAMLVISACNTFDDRFIRFLAPVYLLFVGLALYTHRSRAIARLSTVVRVALIFLALGFGAVGFVTVEANRGRLTELGGQGVGERILQETSGMPSTPRLGPTFNLRGSNVRVLRLRPTSQVAADVVDPNASPSPVPSPSAQGIQATEPVEIPSHLRGIAFTFYNQGRWSPSFLERPYSPAEYSDLNPVAANQTIAALNDERRITVTRLVSGNPLLYIPLATEGLDTGEAEDPEWSREYGGPVRSRAKAPFEYSFKVGATETYQGILAERITPENVEQYLQIPEGFNPDIRQLANRITASARNDGERIEAVTEYLLTTHPYSLTFDPGKRWRNDPLSAFLLSEPKAGAHCEYFATSAAMLLRCVGIPTRYVTGYYAHEGDAENGVIVRQRDAHAWAEAWLDGVGWVTVEATPGSGRPDGMDSQIEPWRRGQEWVQDTSEAIAKWINERTPQEIALSIGGIVVAGGVYGYVLYRKRQSQLAAGFAYSSPEAQLEELNRRFEKAFVRLGVIFPATKPYREHLETLKPVPDDSKRPLRDAVELGQHFARLYDEARFGNRRDPDTLAALQTLLTNLETMHERRSQAVSRL